MIDPQASFEILQRDRRCFVCLKSGHQSSSYDKSCPCCHGNHHQSMCRQNLKRNDASAPNENSLESQNSTLVSHSTEDAQPLGITTASSGTKGNVLLQTDSAIARNEDGSKSIKVKIFFDSGSQWSNVTDNLKPKLGLKRTSTEMLHLNTFGEQSFQKQKCDVTTLLLEDRTNETVKISVLSFPVICSSLPSQVDVTTYPHLHGLQLADCFDSNDPIDVLIGSDYYWVLVTTEIVCGDFGPTAINSRFGWMLSGPTESVRKSHTTTTNLIISGTNDDLLDHLQDPLVTTLRQFWERVNWNHGRSRDKEGDQLL